MIMHGVAFDSRLRFVYRLPLKNDPFPEIGAPELPVSGNG